MSRKERVGIVYEEGFDGGTNWGWGFDLGMSAVVWTSESALNSECSLYKTKKEAQKHLIECFDRKLKAAEASIKLLKTAIHKLKNGKARLAKGKGSGVLLQLATFEATNKLKY